jgi:hypothetical protein
METNQSLEDIKKEVVELLMMTDVEFSGSDDEFEDEDIEVKYV